MKKRIEDLAIFGGTPAFTDKLHVGWPNIGNKERLLQRISDVLDSRRLTNAGPLVRELEQKIAAFVGVKHCIAMCNGTVALEIAIRALGLTGEVIIPSFTFVATAHALQWQEIVPVFCDIDPATHNINPARIEELITPRTSGIIGVHVWGRSCDNASLEEIARRRKIKLIYDAAHAFGCGVDGRMIGNNGNAEVFSFHATKFFNTFEGGAVVTNDDELAAKMRLMKNFGFSGYDNVIHIGTNGKMNEICAAMGLSSLESMSEIIQKNHITYDHYLSLLRKIPGVTPVEYATKGKHNYQFAIAEIDPQTQIGRDDIVRILHAENVIARRYFYPGCHRMEPYRSYYPHAGLLLPETEKLVKRILVLPAGASINSQEVEDVCFLLRFIIENGASLKKSSLSNSN